MMFSKFLFLNTAAVTSPRDVGRAVVVGKKAKGRSLTSSARSGRIVGDFHCNSARPHTSRTSTLSRSSVTAVFLSPNRFPRRTAGKKREGQGLFQGESSSLPFPSFVCFGASDPETETEKSPLDYPQEWSVPPPSKRPDIWPEFEPMETPLPNPMPGDPEQPNEQEEKETAPDPEVEPDDPEEPEEDEEDEEEEKTGPIPDE